MRMEIKDTLASLFHTVGAIQAHIEARLEPAGLSIPKLAALARLVEAGDSLPLGQLAERLTCVKSNVTQLVDRLEADGFVSREFDPTDRRSRLAVITATGRKAYERGIRLQDEAERELFGRLSSEEANQLRALMGKLEMRRQ